MKSQKEEFLYNLAILLEKKYTIFKQTRVMNDFDRGVIHGAISVAEGLGIVSPEELQEVVEKANQKVFGMSLEERLTQYPSQKLTEEDYLDIPTAIRKGLLSF